MNYNLINLGNSFKEFWSKAQTKTFSEKIKLWEKIVEEPFSEVYDRFVWRKSRTTDLDKLNKKQKYLELDWEEAKRNCLQPYFENIYPQYFNKIDKTFQDFDATFHEQIKKFKTHFNSLDFNFSTYAMPSPKFDGIFGSLRQSGATLAFGIDSIALSDKKIGVIISHELAHLYHLKGVWCDSKSNFYNITISLWADGLATYISSLLNPGLNVEYILSDKNLANISRKDIGWLIQKFIQDAENSSRDVKMKWFYIGGKKLRKDLPYRCGYLLGLIVMRELAKSNNLNKILNTKHIYVHERVITTLENLLIKYS